MYRLMAVMVIASLAGVVWSASHVTPSEQCSGKKIEDLRDRIQVTPCGKTRCKLRKGTNTTVHFKFKPTQEVKTLTNDVYANIAGVPLPFIGVAGTSACAHIFHLAPCPLAPDTEYLYENQFHIEQIYPSIALRVHWALNDGQRDVICFEVPAAIQ